MLSRGETRSHSILDWRANYLHTDSVHTTQKSEPLPTEATAVIVGAGYSGLSAALALHDAGIDVVVLEGSERVGGRVHTEVVTQLDGLAIDHGGQWVGPTQTRLLALAARFGCPTFPTLSLIHI